MSFPAERLIVTNGDSAVAALRRAGIEGKLLPWRDVLHDGPVPAGLDAPALAARRARFIAETGWGVLDAIRADFDARDACLASAQTAEEVIIWLEHDLYDQLQLLQILDRVAAWPVRPRVSLVCREAFVAEQEPEALRRHLRQRVAIDTVALKLARAGWRAFTASTPEALATWVATPPAEASVLPFVTSAFARLLAEVPDPTTGLSRTQRHTLAVVARGTDAVGPLFRQVGAMEEARFMGDASFWNIVASLASADQPALETTDAVPFRRPADGMAPESFRAQRLRLTPFGGRLVEGRGDWIEANGIDRWLGGTHLTVDAVWRWDDTARRLAST